MRSAPPSSPSARARISANETTTTSRPDVQLVTGPDVDAEWRILFSGRVEREVSLSGKRTEGSDTRKELNRQMRMAVRRFDLSESDGEAWAFLCECGDDDCQEWVTLPVREYEALQRADEPILAPGHVLSSAQKTRRSARRLVDDAKALGAQAELQLKRATRNLKKRKPN
jgi:hypothetical protein